MSPADPVAGFPSYSYQPRLGGTGASYGVGSGRLHWAVGRREGSVALKDIAEVRLAFSPAKLGSASYEATLVTRTGERFRIGSASRTSLTGITDQGPAYAAFLAALHRGLAAAGGEVRYLAGFSPWRWWLMAPLAGLTALGLLAAAGFTLWQGQWALAVLVAAVGGVVVWPVAEMLWRNRPGTYGPDALPPRLMPQGG